MRGRVCGLAQPQQYLGAGRFGAGARDAERFDRVVRLTQARSVDQDKRDAVAGTTRDSIEVPLAIDGVPLVLIDTAGLRETNDAVESLGIARARSEAARAEILLWLGNPAKAPAHPHLLLIAPKSDLGARGGDGASSVSARTGAGIPQLLGRLGVAATSLLPAESDVALNKRQATAVAEAADLLRTVPTDLLLLAETLRSTRFAFDRLTGRAGVEDAIDALFTRFCLGK